MRSSFPNENASASVDFPPAGTVADGARRPVVIIEDAPEFLRLLAEYIDEQADFTVCGRFRTADEVRRRLPGLNPSIILLDIQLPDGSGIDLLPEIHAMAPLAEIVMLTTFDDPALVTSAVHLGVSGFILKRAGLAEIVEGLRKVSRGGAAIDESVASTILQEFRRREQPLCVLPKLSPQEAKLLQFLANGHNLKEAAHLSGITYQTSRFYLQNAYRKLKVNSMTQAIVMFVRGSRGATNE
jgi:two-component system, NarL family, response regulator DevR